MNHVKISVVASENALQPNEPIANHPHAFGLGNGPGVVCVRSGVVGGLGGMWVAWGIDLKSRSRYRDKLCVLASDDALCSDDLMRIDELCTC